MRLWVSAPRGRTADTVAVFNLGDAPLALDRSWRALGLAVASARGCELWSHAVLPSAPGPTGTVPAHDVRVFRIATRVAC